MLTRRTLGLVASTALLSSACDSEGGLSLPGLPDRREEPDRDQVLAALGDEQSLLDQVTSVRRKHPELARVLAPAEAVHRAHVRLLSGAVEDAETRSRGTGGPVPADPVRAAAEVVRRERELADRHVGTSMACESGDLARVVAVMSAAAAQQAVALAPSAVQQKGSGT